jgi:flagellar basal-body rod modification protein FlgD
VATTVNNLTTLTQDQFLKLLSAQLQNQDPLDPVSDQDLVTQLSQVSTVNGITQLNASFSQILQLQQLTQGASLIGRTVDYAGGAGPASGVVSALTTASDGTINLQIGGNSVPLSGVTKIS